MHTITQRSNFNPDKTKASNWQIEQYGISSSVMRLSQALYILGLKLYSTYCKRETVPLYSLFCILYLHRDIFNSDHVTFNARTGAVTKRTGSDSHEWCVLSLQIVAVIGPFSPMTVQKHVRHFGPEAVSTPPLAKRTFHNAITVMHLLRDHGHVSQKTQEIYLFPENYTTVLYGNRRHTNAYIILSALVFEIVQIKDSVYGARCNPTT